MRLRKSGGEDERARYEKQHSPPEARPPMKVALPRKLTAKVLQRVACIHRKRPEAIRPNLPAEVADADDREHGSGRLQRVHSNHHPAAEECDLRGEEQIEIDGSPAQLSIHDLNPFPNLLAAHPESLRSLRLPQRGDVLIFHS